MSRSANRCGVVGSAASSSSWTKIVTVSPSAAVTGPPVKPGRPWPARRATFGVSVRAPNAYVVFAGAAVPSGRQRGDSGGEKDERATHVTSTARESGSRVKR